MTQTPTPLEEAANPATAPQRLREIAEYGPARQRRVAANPNCPTDLLVWLAKWHWEAMLRNPVLPLLLLEDPGFAAQLPLAALREILRLEEPPTGFLPPLLRHPNAEIRESARLHRANRSIESDSLPRLEVRGGAELEELLSLRQVPAWMLSAALESADRSVRWRASVLVPEAEDDPLRQQLEMLREAGAAKWLWSIQKGKPDMAPEKLAQLARGGPFARSLAARHRNTPPESLALLAELHELPGLRRSAAANPGTSVATLVGLAATGDVGIRRAVARNASSSVALLDQLAGDADGVVRRNAATHRATETRTLARLANDPEVDVRVALARHRALDSVTLRALSKDAEKNVRAAVAHRTNCPLEILMELLQDSAHRVKREAIYNNAMPGDRRLRILRFYSQRKEGTVSLASLAAPPTPEEQAKEALEERLNDKEAPPELLVEAASHADRGIRAQVARHARTPMETLRALRDDSWEYVRRSVAQNPNLPLPERLSFLEDSDPYVRIAVSESDDAPLEVFERLAGDAVENVRSSLTHNKRTPVEVLVRLAREDGADSVLNSFYYSYAHELHDDAVYFALLERFPEKASHMTRLKRYSPALLEALFAAMNPYNRHTILDYQNYDHGYYLRVKDNEYISVPPVEPFSPEMLRRFWQVPDDKYRVATSIRGSVAGYWAVTTEILEEIAEIELADPPAQQIYGWRNFRRFKQSAADTLAEVAGHELTPPAVLTRLMLHVSAKVRLAALDNPNTPREDKIARREPASQSAANSSTLTVRLCALSSPATEHAALRKAAFRGRWMERLAVARNNGAPRQLLAFLSEDSNVAVAAVAREELARRDGAVDSQRNGAT